MSSPRHSKRSARSTSSRASRTSRITPRITEYLTNVAGDRELERFMVFSSGSSIGAQSSSNNSACAARNKVHSACANRTSGDGGGNSTSPVSNNEEAAAAATNVISHPINETIEVEISEMPLQKPSSCMRNPQSEENEDVTIIIPIVFESDSGSSLAKHHKSFEDLRTPNKKEMRTSHTQTPESALKSHKRLEWDPAADVGYKRALSTSNISTLERSVLEDRVSRGNTLVERYRPNQSESDLNRLKGGNLDDVAPPLASSTFLRSKPVMLSKSTNVSLPKQHNQSAQTSARRNSSRQESRTASSMYSSSAASSFDYHKSSLPSSSSQFSSLSADAKLRRAEEQHRETLKYQSELEEILRRRREAKENISPASASSSVRTTTTTTTTTTTATSKTNLDLGIDLLCSLVNARSLNYGQKKLLIRDIAKRISCLDLLTSSRSSMSGRESAGDITEKGTPKPTTASRVESDSSRQSTGRHRQKPPPATAEETAIDSPSIVVIKSPPTNPQGLIITTTSGTSYKSFEPPPVTKSLQSTGKTSHNSRRSTPGRHQEIPPATVGTTVDLSSAVVTDKSPPSTHPPAPIATASGGTTAHNRPLPEPPSVPLVPLVKPPEATAKANSSTSLTDTTPTTSPSREVITQKANNVQQTSGGGDTNTDAEMTAMQEWLNPMTQSEREYEQKKHQNLDAERRYQLDWIEAEIKRLEQLRGLLFRTVEAPAQPTSSSTTNTNTSSSSSGITDLPELRQKLLPLPVVVEEAVPEIPVRQRSVVQATQTVVATIPPPPLPKSPPALPTTALHPKRSPSHRHKQRSKMATPAHSSSGGSESVCSFVQQRQRKFIEHYKGKMLELNALHQQTQERREREQQQQQQQHHHQQQNTGTVPGSGTGNWQKCPIHHRCPCHNHQQQQQHPKQALPYAPSTIAGYSMPPNAGYCCIDDGAIYYQVIGSRCATSYAQVTSPKATMATATATTTATANANVVAVAVADNATNAVAAAVAPTEASPSTSTTSSSTSSMLCISSDISVPMGAVNTSEATTTTTTTTHQYDDVACAARQHLRKQHRQHHGHASGRNRNSGTNSTSASYADVAGEVPTATATATTTTTTTRLNAMKMHRRGIAYIIQFTVGGDDGSNETLSLQDYLQRARPEFCEKSKQRKAILNEMQLLRTARRQELELLLENSNLDTLDKRLENLPPPAAARVRVFSTKEMKAMTSKRCESLPEVLAAQRQQRDDRQRRSNRILRDIFNRRLQRRVRSGQLSLNHSRTVI